MNNVRRVGVSQTHPGRIQAFGLEDRGLLLPDALGRKGVGDVK